MMCWFLPQERAQDSSVKEKKNIVNGNKLRARLY